MQGPGFGEHKVDQTGTCADEVFDRFVGFKARFEIGARGLNDRLEGADRVIFAKLDTEGLEPALIADMLALSGQWTFCIAFEFMPHRYGANVAIELLRTLDKDFAIFEIGYTPNPSSARQVPAIGFESFIADVVKQPWGYVDVLAISRRMPNFDALAARLAKFESRPITFKMVSPKD